MPTCDFKWKAPYLLPPGTRQIQVGKMTLTVKGDSVQIEQQCCLVRGHDGPHRSPTDVIKEQWSE